MSVTCYSKKYRTRVYSGDDDLEGLRECWRALNAAHAWPQPQGSLDYIRHCVSDCPKRLRIVGLHDGVDLVGGAATIRSSAWNYRWRLPLPGRSIHLWQHKLDRAQFCGNSLLAPDDIELQRKILRGVIDDCADADVMTFDNIASGSLLYRLLTTERWKPFAWRWVHREPYSRWMVRLDSDFDDYSRSQFSRHRRQEFKRERRRLEEACANGMHLSVVTAADDVEEYLQRIEPVVRVSWQGRRGKPAQDGLKHVRTYRKLAEQSMFRGYLLSNGDVPIAFNCGYVTDGAYVPERTGYDPAWAARSPGKHLWLDTIKDLFQQRSFQWLDFGQTDLSYKEFFSNYRHDESTVFLMRRQLRPLVVLGPAIVRRSMFKMLAAALRPLGLSVHFRRLLCRINRGAIG